MKQTSDEDESRTAYEQLMDADLGDGAVIALGHSSLHISGYASSPDDITAYRVFSNGDTRQAHDRLILRHETEEAQIEYRVYDPGRQEILTDLEPLSADKVFVAEEADATDDEDLPGFQTGLEVDA